MKKETRYNLLGLVVCTYWYNHTGWYKLVIHTDQAGLDAIEKNPLQDYLTFGTQSVDYVYFDVYQIETFIKKGKAYSIEILEPIKIIESGEFPEKLDRPEFDDDYYSTVPIEIDYKKGAKKIISC